MAMLEDGLKAQDGFEENPVKVRHVVEIVADAIPDEAAAQVTTPAAEPAGGVMAEGGEEGEEAAPAD
jgi:hypothetical protein